MSLPARLLVVVFSLLLSAGVTAKEALRIGIYSKYPPLAYHDSEGLTGIEVAAGEVLAQQLDRKAQFVEMEFSKLIPALQAGEIDIIMSGMTITPARTEQVAFSKPYLDAGQMAIIRFADAGRYGYKGAMFRPGARVAVQKNTTSEAYANESLKDAKVTACDTIEEAFNMLKTGSVDFLVHDAATSWSLATDRSKEDFMSLNNALTDEHLGWAVKKDNTALLQSVNTQLDTMQKNGMLRAIIRKWVPVTVELSETRSGNTPASNSSMKTRPSTETTNRNTGSKR